MIFSSKYTRYLHPSLAWLLVCAGVLMAGMIVSLIMNIKEEHRHDGTCRENNHLCVYRHRFKSADLERINFLTDVADMI